MTVSEASTISRPRIYLAGPDVFFPERARRFEHLRVCCERDGLAALPPWENDGQIDPLPTGLALARLICEDNLRRIREADGLIAHLVNFRGQEPDSGTVFEMGYAVALGKPVVGYGVAAGSYAERVREAIDCTRDARGRLIEVDSGRKVEDMGLGLNLMLACSAPIVGTADEALARIAAWLRERAAGN